MSIAVVIKYTKVPFIFIAIEIRITAATTLDNHNKNIPYLFSVIKNQPAFHLNTSGITNITQ